VAVCGNVPLQQHIHITCVLPSVITTDLTNSNQTAVMLSNASGTINYGSLHPSIQILTATELSVKNIAMHGTATVNLGT